MTSDHFSDNPVTLDDIRPGDLPTLFEHQRDPEANRLADFPPRDREAFMAHWQKILLNPAAHVRAIRVGDRLVGNIVAFDQHDRRLIGYWIDRAWWGRGIATRALTLFLAEETTRPLHAVVAGHNLPSARVLEKCGFRPVPVDDVIRGVPGLEPSERVYRLDRD